jgi:methyltransferase (TIGR00027 family)
VSDSVDLPTGAGVTALGIAQLRASESRRPDALFQDPLAEHFIAAAGNRLPWSKPGSHARSATEGRNRRWSSLANYIAVRTRFFDICLQDACSAGCRQVVILGAGLDARAFRLEWPAGTTVFELDRPDVLAFKGAVISKLSARPRCRRVPVAASLEDDWRSALGQMGFQSEARVAWLAEGLLIYLPEHVVDRTLEQLTQASVPESRLALEHVSREHLAGLRRVHDDPERAGFQGLWQSAISMPPIEWLGQYGWQATVRDTPEWAGALGRPISDPLVGTSSWLIAATRAATSLPAAT